MSDCKEREIQEMLPDVLHGTVGPADRARIDAHLAGCGPCREELDVLRSVHGAAVFTPSIDVESIVRQLPPYGVALPAPAERRVRTPVMRWLVAAGFALVAFGAGSVVLNDDEPATETVAVSVPSGTGLALASGLDGLSDGELVQLMNEMNGFDALPASEPEAVFAVDGSMPTDQDSL
jgi:predicted anti-sigma-YlaC factor YlaD